MNAPVVETVAGRIRGHAVRAPDGSTLLRFLGVPYAAPPVGELRFRAPEPPRAWVGVRPADAFGPAAPQSGAVPSPLPSFAATPVGEDCLTLNVWTPALAGDRPVLVWLHGGAYLSGGSAMGVFDGSRLAADGDAVVVTLNYRLGALGYLVFDESEDGDANCGLRDQLAALVWVHEHAAAFGGDPARITVFGESAGAGSVLHLCVARRRPPVRRAIVQSGEPRTLTVELAWRVRDALTRHLGLAPTDVAALRAVPLDALLHAQRSVLAELGPATGLMPFHPTYDADLVDVDPIRGFGHERARGIDLLIGTTRDELALFPDPRADGLDDVGLARLLARLGGPRVDPARVLAAYRARRPSGDAARIWEMARTDAVLRVPALRIAERQAATGTPTYVYRFDWEAPGLGAAHAVDIPFTFGTFDRDGWGEAVGADASAEALSRRMRAGWLAFARTGDPSHAELGPWPRYEPPRRATMLLGVHCAVADDPDARWREVWD